ncbi:MAG: hypothetical protein H7222_17580 [Methylotenera sp.]|nr:hypothetical protein [Oligoflexia bacterium]
MDEILLGEGHEITLLNRGTLDDGLGERIQRLEADRKVRTALEAAVQGRTWDLVL